MSLLSPPYTDDDDARSTSSSSQSSSKGYETKLAHKLRTVEPERAVRLAARAARNRVSAQKSRDRKKKQMSELENESNQLRVEKAELEERVRTLEDLVKTLLMNQTSIRNCQMNPSSIAAPRENVTNLSKENSNYSPSPQSQQSSPIKALNPSTIHIHQNLDSESHACLPAVEDCPAAGMDSIMVDDVLKEYATTIGRPLGFEGENFEDKATFSLNGSSIDIKEEFISTKTEKKSNSSIYTESDSTLYEPLSIRDGSSSSSSSSSLSTTSATESINSLPLADENSWIIECLESAVMNEEGCEKRTEGDVNIPTIFFNSDMSTGNGNEQGQGEYSNQFWDGSDHVSPLWVA